MTLRLKPTFLSTVSALAVALTIAAAPASADQIINLRSGNGTVGGTDSQITFLQGPADTGFGTVFTGANFTNAGVGAAAAIINRHPAWIAPASFTPDTSAQWIANSAGGAAEGSSALFAIDFTITDIAIASASISFNFAVDNILGTTAPGFGVNQGLFLNGVALSGNTSGGGFDSVHNITRTDIAPLLVSGVNTLYINSTDVGGPGGLLFSTTITTVAGSTEIPEPSLVAIFGLGLIGLGLARREKARRA